MNKIKIKYKMPAFKDVKITMIGDIAFIAALHARLHLDGIEHSNLVFTGTRGRVVISGTTMPVLIRLSREVRKLVGAV